MVPSFVEAVAGELRQRSGVNTGYTHFVAPTRMRVGDQLVVALGAEGDRAYATIEGKLVYQARKPGQAGVGTTLTLVSAGALAVTVDTQANVTVTFVAGVNTWQEVSTLLQGSSTILTEKTVLAPATVLVGGDAGVKPATANPGVGIPYTIETNVPWDFDDALTGSTGAGVRVFRRAVTDDEPLEYTFDYSSPLQIQLGVLAAYRGLAKSALVGGSTSEINNTFRVPCPERNLGRTSVLYIGGMYLENIDNVVPELSGSGVFGADAMRVSARALFFDQPFRSLYLFDSFASLSVPGKYQRSAVLAGNTYGASFSIALATAALAGARETFSPIALGSIGLPAKGI